MNVAIITARKGSKSIRDKNVYEVAGKALIAYPIQAAHEAKKVDKIYVSTDGEAIAQVSRELGCEIIWRPEELGGDHINHGDVISHAVEYVDARELGLECVVVLLGNTVMVSGDVIDEALMLLEDQRELDSAMTVWEAADDHPLRALEIHEGILRPYGGIERQVSTERQSYSKAYYYDQGVWAFRKECVRHRHGPNPWWWMGERSAPLIRPWVTGRDIHSHLDVAVAEWWLAHQAGSSSGELQSGVVSEEP